MDTTILPAISAIASGQVASASLSEQQMATATVAVVTAALNNFQIGRHRLDDAAKELHTLVALFKKALTVMSLEGNAVSVDDVFPLI